MQTPPPTLPPHGTAGPSAPPKISSTAPIAISTTNGAPMTRDEVLAFLRTNLPGGGDSPNADTVRKQLIEMIKKRGVNFHEKNPGEIYTAGGYSVADNIPDAINSNLGAPVAQNWLIGTWKMSVIGGPTYHAPGDGWIYKKAESVAMTGTLSINGNGTYTWNLEPSGTTVKGTWRPATAAEMAKQGGMGIVLLHAADGADWIVNKFMSPNVHTDHIEVEHYQNRGSYRRVGERM